MLRTAARAVASTSRPSAARHRSTQLASSRLFSISRSCSVDNVLSFQDASSTAGPASEPAPVRTSDSTASVPPHAPPAKTTSPATQKKGILFVGRLRPQTDEAALHALFQPHGPIRQVRLVRVPDGRSRRFAFIEFDLPLGAVRRIADALHTAPVLLDGRRLTVSLARAPDRRAGGAPSTLYVDNLPPAASRHDVAAAFGRSPRR
ncbi:hypothetical protein B0H21DRAFT_242592 [Amylocystis lapponica]|nr:hypothetical protein B0H21DRAFT_242592 [Amylocystis lapponica]